MDFILDCDGVLNSISNVRRKYIPNGKSPDPQDWWEWHKHFGMEQPNTEGMTMIKLLLGSGSRISLLSLRHQGLEKETRDYIMDHKLLPRLKLEDIHFCPRGIRGDSAQWKASMLKMYRQSCAPYYRTSVKKGITFIDDSMDNIKAAKDIVTALYYPTFRG